MVVALTCGLVGTVVGVGVTTRALDVSDGDIWVWSSGPGQAGRVNSNSGRVDQSQYLRDSRGHRVQITQNDRYLLLHDLDAGTVTSVDLERMGFTGTIRVPKGSGVEVAMSGNRVAIVDERAGEVRGFDPANLRATGAVIHLPAPLAGGDFDSAGRLWIGVPTQGTVVDVTVGATSASVAKTETVAAAGDPMVLSVLDSGVLSADPKTGRVSVATTTTGVTTREVGRPLAKVIAPARTVGPLAVLTVPGSPSAILPVPVAGTGKITPFALPAGVSPGAATPFAGRIYVPDSALHQVLVYSASGSAEGSLGLAGATGPLELEVREGHLMINAPDSSVARVVDEDGVTRVVDKYQPGSGEQGNGPAVIAAPGTGAPAVPVGVRATVNTDGSVTVTWPAVSDADNYVVQPSGGARPGTSTTTSASFTDLIGGRSYTFTVVARSASGAASDPSAASNAVIPYSAPSAPKLALGTPGATSLTVHWNPVADNGSAVTAYYATIDGGSRASLPADSTAHTFDNLTAGTTHSIQVWAANAAGAGASATLWATVGGKASAVAVTQTKRTPGSATVKVTFSGTASACTVAVTGGDVNAQSHSCKDGGTYTFQWLWASSHYTITAKVTGADHQTATGSTTVHTTVINTTSTCSGSGCDDVYAGPHTSSSVVGTWSYGSSTTVFCQETGDSVSHGGRTSDVWLHIPYPHGFVPLVDTSMTQAELSTVPTYCDAD